MPVESIHHLIACAFVLMWIMIGHITKPRRTRRVPAPTPPASIDDLGDIPSVQID